MEKNPTTLVKKESQIWSCNFPQRFKLWLSQEPQGAELTLFWVTLDIAQAICSKLWKCPGYYWYFSPSSFWLRGCSDANDSKDERSWKLVLPTEACCSENRTFVRCCIKPPLCTQHYLQLGDPSFVRVRFTLAQLITVHNRSASYERLESGNSGCPRVTSPIDLQGIIYVH